MSRDALVAVIVAVPVAVLAAVGVNLAMQPESPGDSGATAQADLRDFETRRVYAPGRYSRTTIPRRSPQIAPRRSSTE